MIIMSFTPSVYDFSIMNYLEQAIFKVVLS